jgi:hypothetical protein
MVLDSEVGTYDSLATTLTSAIERALSLEVWVSRSQEGLTSDSFVRRRTQFDSVTEFCAACPCDRDTLGGLQQLPPEERDAFVARTTDFETWPEMKQSAAITDLVALQNV